MFVHLLDLERKTYKSIQLCGNFKMDNPRKNKIRHYCIFLNKFHSEMLLLIYYHESVSKRENVLFNNKIKLLINL